MVLRSEEISSVVGGTPEGPLATTVGMAGVSEGETVCGMVLRVHDSMLSVCEYTRDGKKRVVLVGGAPSNSWEAGVVPGPTEQKEQRLLGIGCN
jgi:hypothetical protein